MANEKRLIDANELVYALYRSDAELHSSLWETSEIVDEITSAPTVDAVEVVFCDECTNHGQCIPEDTFRLLRIEKPFCCVGSRKINYFGAKMDGDGNG